MDSSTVPDDRAVVTTTITVEDAQRAVQAINAYMASWKDAESMYKGARATAVGAFHGTYMCEQCTLWLVTGWDRHDLSNLLFVLREDGRVTLSSGDFYFLNSDLYPTVKGETSEGNQAVRQEGGIA